MALMDQSLFHLVIRDYLYCLSGLIRNQLIKLLILDSFQVLKMTCLLFQPERPIMPQKHLLIHRPQIHDRLIIPQQRPAGRGRLEALVEDDVVGDAFDVRRVFGKGHRLLNHTRGALDLTAPRNAQTSPTRRVTPLLHHRHLPHIDPCRRDQHLLTEHGHPLIIVLHHLLITP